LISSSISRRIPLIGASSNTIPYFHIEGFTKELTQEGKVSIYRNCQIFSWSRPAACLIFSDKKERKRITRSLPKLSRFLFYLVPFLLKLFYKLPSHYPCKLSTNHWKRQDLAVKLL
jgi:hypothetical protein